MFFLNICAPLLPRDRLLLERLNTYIDNIFDKETTASRVEWLRVVEFGNLSGVISIPGRCYGNLAWRKKESSTDSAKKLPTYIIELLWKRAYNEHINKRCVNCMYEPFQQPVIFDIIKKDMYTITQIYVQ